MHQAMLDGDVEQAVLFETRKAGVFLAGAVQSVVQRLAHLRRVTPHYFQRRPIPWLVIRQTSLDGVDTECEESIEIGVEGGKSEWLQEKVPVEGLEMAQIKNNTVALGN